MKTILIAAAVIIGLSSATFAQSGGTDYKGGHYDRKTGQYHYH